MTRTFIKELDIISFGKFENKKIKFNKTFNLIYGDNESGKSTLSDFIEGILYGFDEGRKRKNFSYKKEKYKPSFSYKYAGRILFSHEGFDILVERNFETGSYKLINMDTKEEIESKPSDLNFPGKYLLNLSYEAYKNLIKNYQSQTLNEDGKKILMEIFMDSSFDLEFSANKAIDNLRKNLDDLGTARAYTKPYYLTKKKVDDLEKEKNSIESLRKDYSKDLKTLYDQRIILESQREKLKKLKEKRDKFRSNLAGENFRQAEKTQKQIDLLDNKLSNYKIYQNLNIEYFNKLDDLIEKNSKENISSDTSKKYIIYLLFVGLIIFSAYYFNKLFILLFLILIYPIYIFMSKDKKTNYQKDIKDQLDKYYLNNLASYKNFKNNYYKYLSLKAEKDKLSEVLNVLDRQEKRNFSTTYNENVDINSLESKINILEREYSKISLENIDFEKKLSYVEEKLKKEVSIKEDLKYYKEKLIDIETEKEANKLAIRLIDESKRDGQEGIEELNNRINEIIGHISKGSYKKITYDEKLKPMMIKTDGTRISLEQVSTGFFDQLSFALKFALREKVSSNKYIIFDDAFINYDEKRLRDALYYLLDLSEKNQIIYFTCHQREAKIFDREEIFVNKIILE
ncbi:MAG: ATP-binding protein [Anaerococcus sp.]